MSSAACEEPNTAHDAQRGVYGPSVRVAAAEEQGQPQQATDDRPAPLWPRRFTSGDTAFATYEPVIDSWKDDKLVAHAPVAAFAPGKEAPKYGLVWFEATTVTDRDRGVVTLNGVRVVRDHFPTAREREATYLDALRTAELVESRTVALDRLQRQVAYGASRQLPPPPRLDATPPNIVVSERPEMLVLVAGAPQVKDDGGVQRVTNTRALILRDNGVFHLWVGDRWFRAAALEGPYSEARDVPASLDAAKNRLAAASTVDLFTDATDLVRQGAIVAVATKPTEVIETRGAPVFDRIPGTTLSYVSNTDSDVLRDDATSQTYLLLSGRWLRAPSMRGPWAYVDAKELPPSLQNIPRSHREARVLAAIPATPEAEEAAIAATIPQTATVDRSTANLSVAYEGEPDFEPIEGASAPMQYAINSTTPVIAASDGLYYAVENGVWFVAPTPNGPWTVATSVPEEIYSIPPRSPIHYVTYVRVYGYSPYYAYVGYTPGYLGAFYTGGVGGVVVFDPFYHYRRGPWGGHVWYGGPYDYPSPHYYGYGRPGWGWYGPSYAYRGNVYTRWRPSVAYAPPAHVAAMPRVSAPAAPSVVGGRAPTRAAAPPSRSFDARPPAAQSIPPRAVLPPQTVAPPSRSFDARPPAAQSIPPRAVLPPQTVTPPSRSFTPPVPAAPRAIPPSAVAPPPRSFSPPPSHGGALQTAPGGAARVTPPSFSPPRVAAPPARGGRR